MQKTWTLYFSNDPPQIQGYDNNTPKSRTHQELW
jgi:hypothetical protein